MELVKVITVCFLASILLTDVMLASPIRGSDVAELERIENAIEEGLSVYNAEKKSRRRQRRRTNRFIAAMRLCLNYRHYPIDRVPEHCREMVASSGQRHEGNGPTIVIIEK